MQRLSGKMLIAHYRSGRDIAAAKIGRVGIADKRSRTSRSAVLTFGPVVGRCGPLGPSDLISNGMSPSVSRPIGTPQSGPSDTGKADAKPPVSACHLLSLLEFGLGVFTPLLKDVFGGPAGLGFEAGTAGAVAG